MEELGYLVTNLSEDINSVDSNKVLEFQSLLVDTLFSQRETDKLAALAWGSQFERRWLSFSPRLCAGGMNERDNTCNTQGMITISTPAIA